MVKNAKVTATPVLEYAGGSVQGTPVVLQGENVRANGQVVSYSNGGTVQIPFNTEYKPEMAESNLYLDFQVDQNGKALRSSPCKGRRRCDRNFHTCFSSYCDSGSC